MGVRYNSAMESSAWKYHSDTGLIESPTGFRIARSNEFLAQKQLGILGPILQDQDPQRNFRVIRHW